MNLKEAVVRIKKIKIKNKEYSDNAWYIVDKKYGIRDLIFLYNL